MKEKNASENKSESKKSKKINKTDTLSMSSSNTKMESVGYEKKQGTVEKIEENSSNSHDKDDNETAKLEIVQLNMNCLVKLEDYYMMESQKIIKTVESEMKQCTETTTEYSYNLPDKNEGIPVSFESSGYRKSKSTKMESVGYEEKQGTSETLLENSSTLPNTDDHKGSVHKKSKSKRVTFNNIENIKKNTSKRHLRDKSNSSNIKEKDASANKSESKKSKKTNKTDTLSMSSSNIKMESVGYEKKQGTVEKTEENSSNSTDKDDNETASFRGLGRRKSRRFIKLTKMESVGYEVEQGTTKIILENSSTLADIDDNETILTESAKLEIEQNMNFSGNLVKLEDTMKSQNTNIYTEEPEMKQCTETTTDYSSNLLDTDDNETILTESAKLEMECSSNSNNKLKRKLSKVEVIVEVLQDYLKRFKSS
ncbi:dentin sialophosphoprotein-like isoform X2 [Metopolophium dirhodum]|uniref:dentin sialophosphoprotein-like isoform X2 n=1 Tax=Metopolophium dirhodum TaxID=44670 RepID=UPI0029905362|nr:dentin sialophosphoprotein-like isoform X2 [Metopolophium dirhodum]